MQSCFFLEFWLCLTHFYGNISVTSNAIHQVKIVRSFDSSKTAISEYRYMTTEIPHYIQLNMSVLIKRIITTEVCFKLNVPVLFVYQMGINMSEQDNHYQLRNHVPC